MQSTLLVATVLSVVLAIHFNFSHAEDKNGSAVGRLTLWGVNKLILPYINILVATFFSWFIRIITVATFGLGTMQSVVGSEGYMWYGYNFLKNYIGFDPLFKLFTGRLPI